MVIFAASPLSLVAIKNGTQVACGGKQNFIEIVDLKKLKVVQRLEGHTDWVRCLSIGSIQEVASTGISEEKMILLSGSRDRTLRYWSLEKRLEEKIPMFVVDISGGFPLSVSQNPDWSYVLVVCGKKWMVQ